MYFGQEAGDHVADGVGGVEEADGGEAREFLPGGEGARGSRAGGGGEEGAVDEEGDELFAEFFGFAFAAERDEVERHLFEVGEVVGDIFKVFAEFEAEEAADAGAVGFVGGFAGGEEAEGAGVSLVDEGGEGGDGHLEALDSEAVGEVADGALFPGGDAVAVEFFLVDLREGAGKSCGYSGRSSERHLDCLGRPAHGKY